MLNNFIKSSTVAYKQVAYKKKSSAICKASLIFKLNLELALSIILKERELYESKHVMVECRCLKICDVLSFLICSSILDLSNHGMVKIQKLEYL